MAATGAGADDPRFPVALRERRQPRERGGAVGHHAVVVHAALGADRGRDVVRGAVAEPAVQVGADHREPVPGQPVAELPVELVPAGQVMHGDDPGPGLLPGRAGHVGVDVPAVAAGIGDHLSCDARGSISAEGIPRNWSAHCTPPVIAHHRPLMVTRSAAAPRQPSTGANPNRGPPRPEPPGARADRGRKDVMDTPEQPASAGRPDPEDEPVLPVQSRPDPEDEPVLPVQSRPDPEDEPVLPVQSREDTDAGWGEPGRARR